MSLLRSTAVFVTGALVGWWMARFVKEDPPSDARPRPTPEPAPVPADETHVETEAEEVAPEPAAVRGVAVSDPKALLAFANGASEGDLAEAGITPGAATALLAGRPYADLDALGSTKGVGPKTLAALVVATS